MKTVTCCLSDHLTIIIVIFDAYSSSWFIDFRLSVSPNIDDLYSADVFSDCSPPVEWILVLAL